MTYKTVGYLLMWGLLLLGFSLAEFHITVEYQLPPATEIKE